MTTNEETPEKVSDDRLQELRMQEATAEIARQNRYAAEARAMSEQAAAKAKENARVLVAESIGLTIVIIVISANVRGCSENDLRLKKLSEETEQLRLKAETQKSIMLTECLQNRDVTYAAARCLDLYLEGNTR